MKRINVHFFHLFTLLFVALKLTDQVDWSWWLVLAPSLFVAAVGGVFLLIAVLILVFNSVNRRR